MESTIEQLDSLFKGGFVNGILTILFYIIVFLIANHLITKFIRQREFKHKEAVLRIKSVLLWTLLIFSVLSQITFLQDIATTLLAGGGIVAVIVGLASQEAASSAVSGMMILMSKPFKVGDYILVNNLEGTVRLISMFYTTIETVDNKIIQLPNGNLSNSNIINYSANEKRRVDIDVSVSYDSDINKVKKIINNIIDEHNLILKNEEVIVRLKSHADSSLVFAVRVWVKTNDYWNVYYDLMELIKEDFDKNKISIPYPQLDVHLKNNK